MSFSKDVELSNQSGKSVIEMFIVLAIAGIILTFAVSQFGRSGSNLDRQNIAREFKVSLERARFDSVKRRAANPADMARVVITSPTSFALLTDSNQNGTIEEGAETRITTFGNRSDVRIVGSDLIFPIRIMFDQRGHARVFNSAAPPVEITPQFIFCNACSLLTANSANSNSVNVSATGTVAMLTGGDALPTFDDPTVTNVSNTAQVNPNLAVWGAETLATPTPDPTVTPVETPTPAETPTETPTGTPTPTPTPVPTPVACAIGARPATDNCQCVEPLYLHANGRCRSR